ncbi:PREDICTED: uncharacterized protein LOC105450066 isoform X2 [Wasmannia auropunctata]|uniref:uncharacterized protein LOC105450066 isoform X2 n=1 Tax=Wasmannia auropunctata TaxID=64793 RepID=UPI0005F06875|nr:PREDICTED: uncharacterized protein LOC105450066 isoform X2 [Wasmannia auropunctata]
MHYQHYDDQEEFEPRITPKPITKLDCLVGPIVPEVSLIDENPIARNPNDASANLPPARSARPAQISDNTMEVNVISPVSHSRNSYATWREQNYSREINSTRTIHVSPLHKNVYNYNTTSSDIQERAKINDKQERLQNVNKNDRMYEKSVKFKYSNTGDNFYHPGSQTDLLPSDKRSSSSDSPQRIFIVDRRGMSSNTTSDIVRETPQQFHVPNYSNYNIDNNETVKTLVQLVNSQNEQIKHLQLQVDRLIREREERMQEENFRSKSTCLYSQPLANPVFRYPINCYDSALASSLAQSQSQGIKKNVSPQSTCVMEKQGLENFGEGNKLETALLEQQSKKAFMEQKVSIGVMTSLEFTVQNSPFLIDSEICEKREAHRENSNNSRNAVNAVNIQHDTTDTINRYKNTFARKPGAAQLENIVEDSESYLSSSQQQSSNFNTSSSAKESSKMYQHPSTGLNQGGARVELYIGKDGKMVDERMPSAKETSVNTSMNVDYNPTESANCSKALGERTNDYVTVDERKNIYKTNVNERALRDAHLPATDYYHNYRNKEYGANTRQVKDVGDSMILSGGDLRINERPPPTPEPSIHVEMQEYTSDEESEGKLRHTPKIGWTFYKNVLGQINEILQNSDVTSDEDQNHAKAVCNTEQENDTETTSNPVKEATFEQIRKLGISLENNEHGEFNGNKTLNFDSSFYPRLDRQANMTYASSVVNETNESIHMKALALKYLSDEQLANIACHKQESSKHFMLSNMQRTMDRNVSLATMRYLERYQLLPGKNNEAENADKTCDKVLSEHEFRSAAANNNFAQRRFPFVQTSGTTCPSRILNISALRQQGNLIYHNY